MYRFYEIALSFTLLLAGLFSYGQTFDLIGPKVDVRVKRGDATLPIASVPNLLPGDRLWVHPDFPDNQATHYILVVAFLRGATNQPPQEWFTRFETWTKSIRSEGAFVNVPEDAQQALLFLVPETGGDFSTLRNAVRSRPGIFVRASQDLQSASLDRMRLDAYLDVVRNVSQIAPAALKERAEKTAHSLGIRVDQQCFDKPTDQQAPCLAQHTDNLLLDDAGVTSAVAQFTSSSKGDLMNQIVYSPFMGAASFSPYFGAVMDTIKILSSMHTAHFQYIPALALSAQDTLNLRLSTAPSFRDPKSVVVIALPHIGPAKPLLLRQVNPADRFCIQKKELVLPIEATAAVFVTTQLHDLKLHIESKNPIDIPVQTDVTRGGFLLLEPAPISTESDLTATIRGKYGFDDWEGPKFNLHSAIPGKWTVTTSDQNALVTGRDDVLHIVDGSSLCVERIQKLVDSSKPVDLTWKAVQPESLEVTIPMKDTPPGTVVLNIHQFGLEQPDKVELKAYAEAASLDRMTLSAGDTLAVLRGTRLDTVAKAELEGITWTPAALSRVDDMDVLLMKANGTTDKLEPAKRYSASVSLQDNRQLKAPVTIEQRRPKVSILSKGSQKNDSDVPPLVHLNDADDLPINQKFVFFLKSEVPDKFPRNQKIEVASTDDSFHTVLSLADGSLMLEDTKTVIGTLDPLARFGSSAFGPLRIRAVSANGISGDWLPVGTLVRLPGFKELRCTRSSAKPCVLSGSNLFLAAAIGTTEDMENAIEVPANFTGTQINVSRPTGGVLYLRLRDDPDTVHTLTMPVATTTKSAPSAQTTTPDAPQATPETEPASQPSQSPASAASTSQGKQ